MPDGKGCAAVKTLGFFDDLQFKQRQFFKFIHNMKSKHILVILVNPIILAIFLVSKPTTVKAMPEKIYRDLWPVCFTYPPNYYAHICYSGKLYPTCVDAECTFMLGGDPLGQ